MTTPIDPAVVERVIAELELAADEHRCAELPKADIRALLAEIDRLTDLLAPFLALRGMSGEATAGPWRLRKNRHPTTDGQDWGWVSGDTDANVDLPGCKVMWEGDAKNPRLLVAAVNALCTLLSATEPKP